MSRLKQAEQHGSALSFMHTHGCLRALGWTSLASKEVLTQWNSEK